MMLKVRHIRRILDCFYTNADELYRHRIVESLFMSTIIEGKRYLGFRVSTRIV